MSEVSNMAPPAKLPEGAQITSGYRCAGAGPNSGQKPHGKVTHTRQECREATWSEWSWIRLAEQRLTWSSRKSPIVRIARYGSPRSKN